MPAFDPGIECREAKGNRYQPSGSAWVGAEAITQNLFMKIPSDFDGFTLHPKEIHDAGETVVIEGRNHPEVADRLAAISDRASQVGQHPAPVMGRRPLRGQRRR